MSKKKYNLNTIYISERLQENLKPISQSAFTAVTAPMGYGKTTAISWYLDKQSKNGNSCVIRGALPGRQLKLILAWCELHKDELMQNWELARTAAPLNHIAPLI